MRILHVIPTTNRTFGGPAQGLRSILAGYQSLGCEAEVLSNDLPEDTHSPDMQVAVHRLGPGLGNYGYNPRMTRWIEENYRRFDGIVTHSIWQYPALAIWRVLRKRRPYAVFTHGMLDPWFRRRYPLKHLKKYPYWLGGAYPMLRDARRVLFTSQAEQELARESFWPYYCRGEVVPYGIMPPTDDPDASRQAFLELCPGVHGRRYLLFAARFHEKKGADLLVEAFARVSGAWPDLDLVMAGPDNTGLQATLMAMAERLGVAERVHWPGMLTDAAKWGAFRGCEAFVLPSHQENFGVAVAEALACGRPVLISNKVNIHEEIERSQSGLVDDDTLEGTVRLLERYLNLDEADRMQMAENGLAQFQTSYNSIRTATAIGRIFASQDQD